jgi:hypothetical protein
MASGAATIPTSPPLNPQALLARIGKGKESKLSYAGHVLMENRHGLAVNCGIIQATGRTHPEAALAMVEQIPGWHRVTRRFACKPTSIIDQRTMRPPGYALSQRKRK